MFYHKETFYHKCKCLLAVAVVLILCGAPPPKKCVVKTNGSDVASWIPCFFQNCSHYYYNFNDHKHNSGID